MKLEIAVQDARGAAIAHRAGADRVELCAALGATGGITPSAGAIEQAVATGIAVHVLIRPRSGDYDYRPHEIATMITDIAIARGLGAAGVVIGALTPPGLLDEPALRAMIDAADGGEVTFHRAIDVCPEPVAALERLIDLGFTRVLTSGGAPRAGLGLDQLAALVRHAAGRIEIQAGGGLLLPDIDPLARAGVDAVHLSARELITTGPAGPGGGPADFEATSEARVIEAVAAVRTVAPDGNPPAYEQGGA